MTRAMKILSLSYAKKRRIYGENRKRVKLFFIGDIGNIEDRLIKIMRTKIYLTSGKKAKQLEIFQ